MALRIRWEWTGLAGGPYLSTFNFRNDAADAQVCADAVEAFFANCVGVISDACTVRLLTDVDVFDVQTGLITSRETVDPAAVVGTSAGQDLPPYTQGLIRLSTGQFLGGREVRGRLFMAGVTEDFNTSGVPTYPYLSTLQVHAQTLADHASADWGVYSRKNHSHSAVSGVAVWGKFAVLRSRRD